MLDKNKNKWLGAGKINRRIERVLFENMIWGNYDTVTCIYLPSIINELFQ